MLCRVAPYSAKVQGSLDALAADIEIAGAQLKGSRGWFALFWSIAVFSDCGR
jgi:hypothetical protein